MKNKTAALEDQAKENFSSLPSEINSFSLKKIFAEDGDKFIYFTYADEKNHRSVTSYFHEETAEFKVRVTIGLAEFCLTKFFTTDFSRFAASISSEIESVIKNFSDETTDKNPLLTEKKFADWEYGKNLPKNLEGFELFISPQNPVRFTNGSHIIVNYSDFAGGNDLTIFYNIYGENFSGETRIKNVPHVSYNFDAENLKELENKLTENLAAELARIKNS